MPDTIEKGMFFGAKPQIFEAAKRLRDNLTPAEELLWKRLNKDSVLGLRFKSQHPIDIFIADFYCHIIRLVIEVDGGIHNSLIQKDYDIGREAEMDRYDIKTIRFTNEEIETNITGVMRKIVQACIDRKKELGMSS
jgi:very-short-patch-repair endonuclease